MSDYHRICMQLADLCERGHRVQIEKSSARWEVTVYEPIHGPGHDHTSGEYLSDVMREAHRKALAAWDTPSVTPEKP